MGCGLSSHAAGATQTIPAQQNAPEHLLNAVGNVATSDAVPTDKESQTSLGMPPSPHDQPELHQLAPVAAASHHSAVLSVDARRDDARLDSETTTGTSACQRD